MSPLLLDLPFIAILTFTLQSRHLLLALLSLEIAILLTSFFAMMMFPYMFPLVLTILTVGACGASIGLGLLVSMSRQYGSDMMNLLTLSKW